MYKKENVIDDEQKYIIAILCDKENKFTRMTVKRDMDHFGHAEKCSRFCANIYNHTNGILGNYCFFMELQ